MYVEGDKAGRMGYLKNHRQEESAIGRCEELDEFLLSSLVADPGLNQLPALLVDTDSTPFVLNQQEKGTGRSSYVVH